MPLSEFYGLANGKKGSPQSHRKTTADVSYIPNDEFMELVWEKGQIMMQGQSSNARKAPVSSSFQFHTSKVEEKEGLLSGTSAEVGLTQHDDVAPWLNFPLEDYCSDLLPEISGVTVNEPSTRNGFSLVDNRDGWDHIRGDAHSHGVVLDKSKASSSKGSNLFPWSLDCVQIPTQSLRPGVSAVGSNNGTSNPHNIINGNSILGQKQDSILPCTSSSLLNFSHLSRPAAIARDNLQADLGSSGLDVVKNGCGSKKEVGFLSRSSSALGKVVSNPLASKPLDASCCVKTSDPVHSEVATEDDKSPNVALDASGPKGDPDAAKSVEPIGASSSVCSGNSGERASNDMTKALKRKSRDMDDFECQSEDVEEESLCVKTAATSRGGTGSKRSRAAEVHNLSERRRRDRINEKMRALQELIPNCNKVDKASMLDEAIEYLKTLQLQVQIMSMGSGFYMPPTVFSNVHPTHVPHFPPMGMGYGPYGMGMVDMNGGSQGHPLMMTLGPRYPFNVFQGIPGQGMPVVFPQQPITKIPTNPAVTHTEFPNLAPISKDPIQNRNPHVMIHTSHQVDEGLDQSALVGKNDQVPQVECSNVVPPPNSCSKPPGLTKHSH